jgi:hypothetical protein
LGEAKGSNQPGAMVLGLSDFQDPNANNKMDMMATAIKHRINKSMRASQLNDKHTTHKRREKMQIECAGPKQLNCLMLFMSSSLGSAPIKKVPTKKPKFLADTREKIRRLKKQRSQIRQTPAAAAGQRRNTNKQGGKNTHSKHTAHRNQTTSLEWPPVSNYQLAGQPADPHTHESNGGDHAKET